MLTRDFYLQNAPALAENLLGRLLVHKTKAGVTAGMIVEAEAYAGPEDKGAHSYGGRRSDRTEVMFGLGGHAYIYFIYGMYHCFNVVAGPEGKPEAVLIRALEPVQGVDLMGQRRGISLGKALCNGPGKLCAAMGLTKENYGQDLCDAGTEEEGLYIEDYQTIEKSHIYVSPRINIDYAEEYRDVLWRFYIKDNPYVSKVPGKYKGVPFSQTSDGGFSC